MTEAQLKQAMADVRSLAIDDADSIIKTFHQNLYHEEEKPLLPNLTEEEKARFVKAEKELNGEKEKRQLDETVDKEAEVPVAKKTKLEAVA
ncbi:hypothetical protein MMC14_005288 [Varicellaria rhodocarpa]|nr:hypothetical protein [Varicellaria rhodocarpa]